jgi:hypothetical protein
MRLPLHASILCKLAVGRELVQSLPRSILEGYKLFCSSRLRIRRRPISEMIVGGRPLNSKQTWMGRNATRRCDSASPDGQASPSTLIQKGFPFSLPFLCKLRGHYGAVDIDLVVRYFAEWRC